MPRLAQENWEISFRLTLGALALDIEMNGASRPVALIGPNGSGKTTLLRTIAGAYRPEEGRIQLGAALLFGSREGVDLPPERRRVGYVPQGSQLFPHLSALDNVAFGQIASEPRSKRERRRVALSLLARLGCEHLARRAPAALSGGEQQRVALCRALMIEPRILLLDEPLSALDAPTRRSLRAYLAEHLNRHTGPSIVVTHDLRDVQALGAEVLVIEGGKIVQRGSAAELQNDPATAFVAEFFDAPLRA